MLHRPVIPLLLRPYQLRDDTKHAMSTLPDQLGGSLEQPGAEAQIVLKYVTSDIDERKG